VYPEEKLKHSGENTLRGSRSRATYRVCANLPNWTKFQYANSMVIASDGSIFIGMRMFVLKLRPDEGQYKEEWLLPAECRESYLDGTNCICKP
jgi:hypothetical protein